MALRPTLDPRGREGGRPRGPKSRAPAERTAPKRCPRDLTSSPTERGRPRCSKWPKSRFRTFRIALLGPPGERRGGASDQKRLPADSVPHRLEVPARADLHPGGKWSRAGPEVGKIAMRNDFGGTGGRVPREAGTPTLARRQPGGWAGRMPDANLLGRREGTGCGRQSRLRAPRTWDRTWLFWRPPRNRPKLFLHASQGPGSSFLQRSQLAFSGAVGEGRDTGRTRGTGCNETVNFLKVVGGP